MPEEDSGVAHSLPLLFEVVKQLQHCFLRKAPISIAGVHSTITPLSKACIANREPVVKLLLENGADVNAKLRWAGSALQSASTV